MSTIIEVEVLEDGTVSVKTGDVEETKHIAADDLLKALEDELGGERKMERRTHPFWNKRKVLRGGKIVRTR